MTTPGRALAALLAAAVIGAALGVAADRAWIGRVSTAAQAGATGQGMSGMTTATLVDAMRREVGLDEAQSRRVMEILDNHQRAVDSAWRFVRPGVHAAIDSAQREIDGVLTPAQRARYRAWIGRAHGGMGRPTGTR